MRIDNPHLNCEGGQGYATYPAFVKGVAAIFQPASPIGMSDAASVIGKCNLQFVTGPEQSYVGSNQ